jgi:hypothetical protein
LRENIYTEFAEFAEGAVKRAFFRSDRHGFGAAGWGHELGFCEGLDLF